MAKQLFPANERGHNNFGWLDTNHTFSFGEYFDPKKIHFGALRVFNDDIVVGGAGFGTHPHHDMEIISIPTHGILAHRDSMGHEQLLHTGEVQVMSAGTGLTHSEYNGSESDDVKFFQIWIIPSEPGIQPSYDQKVIPDPEPNSLELVVGPIGGGAHLSINQDAWLSRGHLVGNASFAVKQRSPQHGTFVYVVEGNVTCNGETLTRRDAIGISDEAVVTITSTETADVIVIEVPMI